MLRIERVHEYPTMHYFADPRHIQSMIAYMIFTEYFWNFLERGSGAMGRAWVFQTRGPVCSIPGGLQWCQARHQTSNVPVQH